MLLMRFCVYVTISLNRNAHAAYATSVPFVFDMLRSTILIATVVVGRPMLVLVAVETRLDKVEKADEAALLPNGAGDAADCRDMPAAAALAPPADNGRLDVDDAPLER